jgi:microcystin-dependent protein
MDPFIGEVRLLPYNFVPPGWIRCEGQLLSINQYGPLFSIINTMYGGNGKTTFALPDLRDHAVVGAGQGPGLSSWYPGTERGSDSVTLLPTEMPSHNHRLYGLDVAGEEGKPTASAFLGQDKRGGASGNIDIMTPSGTPLDGAMDPLAMTLNGNSQPHENRQPFLTLVHCIAYTGVYPPRP